MNSEFDRFSISNLSLLELTYQEHLSVRATNVCQNNNLVSLHQILEHYTEYRTFLNFRNCGKNTEKELIELCLKYLASPSKQLSSEQEHKNQEGFALQILNISLQDLAYQNHLSEHTVNICNKYGLTSLYDIFNHYNRHHGFRNLAGCGTKVAQELITLSLKMEQELFENFWEQIGTQIDFSVIIPNPSLDELARQEGLSVRTLNVCRNHNLSFHDDIFHHYHIHRTFMNLQGCGTKTEEELVKVCQKTEGRLFELCCKYPCMQEELEHFTVVATR